MQFSLDFFFPLWICLNQFSPSHPAGRVVRLLKQLMMPQLGMNISLLQESNTGLAMANPL